MRKDTHDNDNEQLSFITLSAATKNVTRYLVTKEAAPSQQGDFSNSRTEDGGTIKGRIFARLSVHQDGAAHLEPEHDGKRPLRNAHGSDPHEKQNEKPNRETDRGRTQEQRDKDHRAYIERHLRDIAEFEDRARGKKKRI